MKLIINQQLDAAFLGVLYIGGVKKEDTTFSGICLNEALRVILKLHLMMVHASLMLKLDLKVKD